MGNTPYKTAAHFAVPIVLRCTKEKLGMNQAAGRIRERLKEIWN